MALPCARSAGLAAWTGPSGSIRWRLASTAAGHGIALVAGAGTPFLHASGLPISFRPASAFSARPEAMASACSQHWSTWPKRSPRRGRWPHRSMMSASAAFCGPTWQACCTKPNTQGCSAHEQIFARPFTCRHRRSGRLRQDRADGCSYASTCGTAMRLLPSPTTSTPNGTPNISCAPARSHRSALPVLRLAAAHTPPSARMRRSISPRWPDMRKKFP